MANNVTGFDDIEGYAAALSYLPGEVAQLCTSTDCPTFDINVYSWNAQPALVWSTTDVVGRAQPTPADADANGCGWDVTVEIPIPLDWPSGFYLVEFVNSSWPSRSFDESYRSSPVDPSSIDRTRSYTSFVVRAPSGRRAETLLVLATNTWNAYNNWGGKSLYTGGKQVSFSRPWGRGLLFRPPIERDDRKSRPRRFREQPDLDGQIYEDFRHAHGYAGFAASAGWYTYERRFVEWAAQAGIPLDVATSLDLETVDGLTDGYRTVVGVGHDEYWSAGGRDAVEAFVRRGGDYVSLSGNTMFWQVRNEPAADGRGNTPSFTMVCHKYSARETDPILATNPKTQTGMWSDPVTGRPERAFLGAASMYGLYSRFGMATPLGAPGFLVCRDDHWVLAGTGMRYGDMLGADDAVVGYENVGTRVQLDDVNLPVAVLDPALAHDALPHQVEIVALTPASNLRYGEYPKSIAALDDQGDLEQIAYIVYGGGPVAEAKVKHGNAVILVARPYDDAASGEVRVIGSCDWVFGLAHDPAVQQVTLNLITHHD